VSGHKISGDIKEPTLSPKAVRASSVGRGVARAVVWKKIGLRGSGHELGHPVQQEVTLAKEKKEEVVERNPAGRRR
jgi:hypothetical protein